MSLSEIDPKAMKKAMAKLLNPKKSSKNKKDKKRKHKNNLNDMLTQMIIK